jgi:hypothetical protein
MIKVGRRTGTVKGTRMPGWIDEKDDQRKWNGQFIRILKRDYRSSDSAIFAILSNKRLSQICATKIRSYVDKGVTIWWYKQSKARGAKYKKQLGIAIGGLRAAIVLCRHRGNREPASLGMLANEFSLALGRCKQAFATKRHGRDRDHSFLFECHSFLQTKLRQPVTYVTLANLVNAGFEADGSPLKEPVNEEQIQKNLINFKRNNPLWRLYSSTK